MRLTLPLDCLVYDGEAPYLRYLNHKMQREAFVPIGPDTAELIKVATTGQHGQVSPRPAVPVPQYPVEPGRQPPGHRREVPAGS